MLRRVTVRLSVAVTLLTMPVAVGASGDRPNVRVREVEKGYVIEAQFVVEAPALVVRRVLTDYEQIPKYMPGVRRSVVLERGEGHLRVEQEAVSRYMLFSKTVHVVLDVREAGDDLITFRDECGRSFARYEGSWRITEQDGRTVLAYQLTAQPAFAVPSFLVGRVLGRDADDMITHLRAEIVRRAQATAREEARHDIHQPHPGAD